MGHEQSSQAGAAQQETDATRSKMSSDADEPEDGRSATAEVEYESYSLPKTVSKARIAKKSRKKKKRKAVPAKDTKARSDDDEADVAHTYSTIAAAVPEPHTPAEPAAESDQDGETLKGFNDQHVLLANGVQNSQFRVRLQDRTCSQTATVQNPLELRPRKVSNRYSAQHSVVRCAQAHSNQGLQCIVCAKTLSRADKLRRHQLLHSKEELEEALQRNRNADSSDVESEGQRDEIPQEGLDESGWLQTGTDTVDNLQEVPDNAPIEPKLHDATVNEDEPPSTKPSTPPASLFDEPVDTDLIEETPRPTRPKPRLKRKRKAPSASPSADAPSNEPHKRKRRKHSLSPPSSVEVSAEEEEVDVGSGWDKSHGETSIVLADSASVPKTTKPKTAKLGNLDNFAKPWTPGSQLHHPIHNPRSPRVKSSQRVQIAIPRISYAESSTRAKLGSQRKLFVLASNDLDDNQTPSVGKGQEIVYTSPKGKRRAEDGIAYLSSLKAASVADDSVLSELEGMATTVARRGNVSQGNRKRPRKELEESDVKDDEGRKGQFSIEEVRKVERWRDHFCEDYDINIPTFNQMMTDSCRRGKNDPWPYKFITRNDFLKEYYDTLPDRNRRSMSRYRERAFQNIPDKQEWTMEDDRELQRLVKEIGQKWVEIGQLMTRTQDSVSQRWRFKLQYQEGIKTGEWLKSEEERLKEAVAQVKRESGLPQDPTADVRISWDSVSKKLKSKRTAQQCSNKWRLMHYKRSGNKFVKPSELEGTSSTPPDTTTPSKMSQRLAGQTPSSLKSGSAKKRRFISDERVHDSGDEENTPDEQAEADMELFGLEYHSEAGSPIRKALTKTDLPKLNKVAMKTKTPNTHRSKLTSQTPQAGMRLSQAFNQTQANTSALRAPDSIRYPYTQVEMPTPGIPIQRRPISSSAWRAINQIDSRANSSDIGSDQEKGSLGSQEDENAIMAEPQTSDDDQSTKSVQDRRSEQESSVDTSSESDEIEDREADDETTSEAGSLSSSRSDSSAESASENSAGSTPQDSENEDSKDKFVRSLTSQRAGISPLSRAALSVGRKGDRTLLANVLARKGLQPNSESDSEDEGDINHH